MDLLERSSFVTEDLTRQKLRETFLGSCNSQIRASIASTENATLNKFRRPALLSQTKDGSSCILFWVDIKELFVLTVLNK